MSIQIPADTTLRVDTNPDGSLTLHFDRKRPLDPETTPIEATEITDADVTGTVADDTRPRSRSNDTRPTCLARRWPSPRRSWLSRATTRGRLLSSACSSQRCEEKPGDDLIETHRKYFFTVSPQRDSVLSIAQTLDPTFPTIKMGKLAGLKMLNDKKLAVQAKKMQEKQQTGRLAIRDGQQAYTALYDAARTVVSTEPSDETAVLCEDLLAFSLQLRMNEASPHAHRDDGHRLSADDFVIQDRVCRFAGGSKSHSNVPRAEYDKICLFDDETTKGLLRHIFFDGRKSIGNERKAVLSRTQLEHHGIMQYITDVSDKYTRGKWRGIGASFLIRLYDDETTVCSEMGTVATAQASLNHVSSNTTAGYLAYKFEGDYPQKIGKIALTEDGKRKVTMY